MNKFMDICRVKRKYTDAQGKQKNVYEVVGTLFSNEKGQYIKLDTAFNPAGCLNERGECWLTIFEKKQDHTNKNSPAENIISDVPF